MIFSEGRENLQRAFGGERGEFEKREKVKGGERVREIRKESKRDGGSGLGRDKGDKNPQVGPLGL